MRLIGLKLATFCLSLSASSFTYALKPNKNFDDYVLDTWSIEQGLPQITVNAIAQGPQNYLWVGTQAGLARFDGLKFKVFDSGNTPALAGPFIHDLHLDQQKRLWIATYKGLSLYQAGEFAAVPLRSAKPTQGVQIYGIAESTELGLFFASELGLLAYRNGALELVSPITTPVEQVIALNNAVFAATEGKLWKLNGESIKQIELPEHFQQATVTAAALYQSKLWFATNKGPFILDPRIANSSKNNSAVITEPNTANPIYRQAIETLASDADGQLWLSTGNGLRRLYRGKIQEPIQANQRNYFPHVKTIFEDHEHNLWFGSQIKGVARAWSGRTQRYSSNNGLNETLVWSVLPQTKGKGVWTGTASGLALLQGEQFSPVLQAKQLPHPMVYAMLDEGDTLWIAARKGLTRLVNGEINPPGFASTLASAQISSIVRDSQGRLWFGAQDGVYLFSKSNPENRLKKIKAPNKQALIVRTLVELKNGKLLAGTQKGLYSVTEETLLPLGHDNGLNDNLDVTAICELKNGTLLLGTLSKGLFALHKGKWHPITQAQGLPVNAHFTLIEDNHGSVWASGFKGLYKFPVAQLEQYLAGTRSFINAAMYLSESGTIIGSQKALCCNGAGSAKVFLKNNHLWYASRDGVVRVNTQNTSENIIPPKVVIERLQYANTWQTVGTRQHFSLTPSQRDIAFEFTALSFRDPKSVQFKYRLFGYHQAWQKLEPGSPRRVNFTNLPPGNYRFAVQASNSIGIWASETRELKFSVGHHYYETTWFFLVIIMLGALAIFTLHRLRIRSLNNKKIALEKKVSEHTAELNITNKKLQQAVLALKEASFTDQLSGLKNRRFLEEQLPNDIALLQRNLNSGAKNSCMIFVLLDIDHFKRINDTYGHSAGDKIICQFSQRIKQTIREGDYAIRWGGEEFLLILRATNCGDIRAVTTRLKEDITAKDFSLSKQQHLKVNCSMGLANYPFFPQSPRLLNWQQTVELADQALYYVKKNGRNNWAYIQPMAHSAPDENSFKRTRDHFEEELAKGTIKLVKG